MKKLNEISQQTIKRYSDRYERLGCDIKTLGWGTKEQQEYRFNQTLDNNIKFENKVILDIGCGFGDYYNYLNINNMNIKKYIGFDINSDLIFEAKKKYQNDISIFAVENILNTKKKNIADIGIMFGVLNFHLKEKMDNFEYSKNFITKAFELVNDILIVDFISTNVIFEYPKEDFIYYHSPAQVLEFAFTLSKNVVLKHNYSAIPQKEFMLFIYKD